MTLGQRLARALARREDYDRACALAEMVRRARSSDARLEARVRLLMPAMERAAAENHFAERIGALYRGETGA